MPLLGDGTIVTVNDGVSSAHVALPGILTIDPPKVKTPETDVTALDTTPGLLLKMPLSRDDLGTFGATCHYEAEALARLEAIRVAARDSQTSKEWKIQLKNNKVMTFPGYVTDAFVSKIENQKPTEMEFMVTLTGHVVVTTITP